MMSIKKILLSAVFTVILALPAYAEPTNDALMTINFKAGNSTVYQDNLFIAVREAVKAKSTVVFDVVSTSPQGKPNIYGVKVADDIKKIGVNPAQVTYRVESSNDIRNEVVRIFVR